MIEPRLHDRGAASLLFIQRCALFCAFMNRDIDVSSTGVVFFMRHTSRRSCDESSADARFETEAIESAEKQETRCFERITWRTRGAPPRREAP
jgi:hypothetical protein